MSDNKTPSNKKTANKSQSTSPFPGRESPSPLTNNSFTLATDDLRTSNPRFGPIGGPAPATQKGQNKQDNQDKQDKQDNQDKQKEQPQQLHFRYVTTLANLDASAASHRALRSNQPGNSFVTSLPTWRRGADQEAAPPRPARDEGDGDGLARIREQATAYQGRRPREYGLRVQLSGGQGVDAPQMPREPREPREPFRPMNSKLNPEASQRPLTDEEKLLRDMKGISHNYQGDSNNPANESADIRDDENCSVWITNLPPDCTYRDLLSAIGAHHPGKVFASYISPPSDRSAPHLISHRRSAAKVVFYQPWMAQHLIHVARGSRLWVRGYAARAVPNRIRAAPQSYENHTTRCLEVEGPAADVSVPALAAFWDGYFEWHTDEVVLLGEWVDSRTGVLMRRLVWRFGSHRAQAVAAFNSIRDYRPHLFVVYAADPCDVQVLQQP